MSAPAGPGSHADEICACGKPAELLTLNDHGHVLAGACPAHRRNAVDAITPDAWLLPVVAR